MPQIDRLARAQANVTLAGSYTATNEDNTTSHLTLTSSEFPGLKITTVEVNNTNYLDIIAKKANISKPSDLDFRLYPTNLETESIQDTSSGNEDHDKTKHRAFCAVTQDMSALADAGTPTCDSWQTVDVWEREGLPLDEFVFELREEDGIAVAVRAVGLGVVFKRV